MKKHFKWVTVLATTAALLAACGTDEAETTAGGKKVFVAGTEATFAPFEYMDEKGNVQGIDKELMDAIAAEMDVEIEMKNVGWDSVFEGIKGGTVDIGASAITITEKRQQDYDFTTPYFEATQLIVVKSDSNIKSLADLEGKKVSVQINTTGHEAAKKAFGEMNPDIAAFENLPTAILEMLNGSVDATIADNAVVYEYMKNNPDKDLKVIEDTAFEKEQYGFMVKKGNEELLKVLNEGLEKLEANGKLAEITGLE